MIDKNNINSYSFNLPKKLIALKPVEPRSASRLLVYDNKSIIDSQFSDLSSFLKKNDRLIFNNTKVLPARLHGRRVRSNGKNTTAASVEVLLTKQLSLNTWLTLCKPCKKLKNNDKIFFEKSLSAIVKEINSPNAELQFSISDKLLADAFSNIGQLPLPPYILKQRSYSHSDSDDYQTIFAEVAGAIAAPTAALHFDKELLDRIRKRGIDHSFVTLHVGEGTFTPVKEDLIKDHKMHSESGSISKKTASAINKTKQNGGRIIPVGTTSLRLLESSCDNNGTLKNFSGETDIFITPGYKFKISDGLITNFHLPKSTLLLLVSAFIGITETKRIYDHALQNKYRFLSFGDGSLLLP